MDKSIHTSQYAAFRRVFREIRIRAGLTQVDLAKRIGETQSFVSKIERGERRLDIAELRQMCAAFGITLGEFVAAFEAALPVPKVTRAGRKRPKPE